MIVDRSREKLLNAIIYFVSNTKRCHTLKIFKLLHFLDFEHFRQTGRPVTGLAYKAWPNGPAPRQLWNELKQPPADMAAALLVYPVKDDLTDETLRRVIKARKAFDAALFSKRELDIMQTLAMFFEETDATDMTQISHARKMPWGKVYGQGEGRSREIPYELSLTSEPIIGKMESLSRDEYEYRKDAFKEIDARR